MKKMMTFGLSVLAGTVVGYSIARKIYKDKAEKNQLGLEKYQTLFFMMNQWMKVKQERKELADYFRRKGYRKIAIYGMGFVGETLIGELKNSDIEVAYGIDQKADAMYSDINVLTLYDELESVDAVVVTAITYFREIEEKLLGKMDCPVISLEDILYEA